MEFLRVSPPRDRLPELVIRGAKPSEVFHLFEASTAHFQALYPSESNHLLGPEEFEQRGALLLGAEIEDLFIACVGLIPQPQSRYGEVKRLFVDPAWRGQGIARLLMQALEKEATKIAITTLQLESGSNELGALTLYRSLGYEECAPFGSYSLDPNSVFFEKFLPENPD